MIETIEFKGKKYPKFQAEGNAAQFAIPFAMKVCSGIGVDVGCMKREWAFPGSHVVDPILDSKMNATNFPYENLDYIFSSHCLEHIPDWVSVMNYWYSKLKVGGVLFLYLPHYSQEYWRPWNNKKHVNSFTVDVLEDYMVDRGYKNVYKSGVDLNNSFSIIGEK